MTRQSIIERTIKIINLLPEEKAEEISDFADFIFKQFEEKQIAKGIQQMTATGEAFNFLNEDDELYVLSDLKERYNG